MLSSRLKQLRLDRGLTQEQLGKMIHVTKVSICGYEKGDRIPSLDTLLDLANALKVDLNTLVGYDKYIVSDNNIEYGLNVSREELDLILELRRHNKLYESMISNPKRTISVIDKKY